MSTAVLTTAPATLCDRCGDDVLRRYTTTQRPIVLDAEPVPGGIYHLDRQGRAERRSLVVLFAEQRAGLVVNGYEPHDCHGREWYDPA